MKALPIIGLLGLALVAATAGWLLQKPTPMTFSATADQLYQRHVLTAAGRDELLRRIRLGLLKYEQTDPIQQTTQEHHVTNQATILAFCAEAFQAEFSYRTLPSEIDDRGITDYLSDIYIAGQGLAPPDSATEAKRKAALDQQAQELTRFNGDTAALLRWQYEQLPARLKIEDAVPTEDSVLLQGWTIYPPLGGEPGTQHWISEQRSVFGKTRTRTADDLLALQLITTVVHQQIRQQLQQGELQTEAQVCQTAAELMQRRATYAQDQIRQGHWLDQLEKTGQLSPAQRQQLNRDTRPYELKSPFEIVGYCKQGRILDLQNLPRLPQKLYPALFAHVQSLLPDF
ncbi:hypothetical protein [Hymenobacter guriensis]|uniref:Lipoprotein n=1 Tax=Hymenobacter guriensis TaxID=2793065 RepID=A0ABS0L5B9_9BACT|nr:hypothetical protein [Hymenobacter guriensis]MBG8555335.1 hypothetical protein [Hymenobacter guriensis]